MGNGERNLCTLREYEKACVIENPYKGEGSLKPLNALFHETMK